MKILNIETATSICGVSVSEDEKFLGEFVINISNLHDEKLIEMISLLLKNTNVSFSDLGAISISAGPGSFTGLRIGFSVAKGLCISKDLKMVTIPTLDIMADSYFKYFGSDENNSVCVTLPSRKNEFYFALYEKRNEEVNRLSDYHSEEVNILLKKFNDIKFIGDICFHPEFGKSNNKQIKSLELIDMKSLASLGYRKIQKNEFCDVEKIEPLYIKDFIPILK